MHCEMCTMNSIVTYKQLASNTYLSTYILIYLNDFYHTFLPTSSLFVENNHFLEKLQNQNVQ